MEAELGKRLAATAWDGTEASPRYLRLSTAVHPNSKVRLGGSKSYTHAIPWTEFVGADFAI